MALGRRCGCLTTGVLSLAENACSGSTSRSSHGLPAPPTAGDTPSAWLRTLLVSSSRECFYDHPVHTCQRRVTSPRDRFPWKASVMAHTNSCTFSTLFNTWYCCCSRQPFQPGLHSGGGVPGGGREARGQHGQRVTVVIGCAQGERGQFLQELKANRT